MNTERDTVSLGMQFEYGKIRIRKTPNTNIFHTVRVPSNKVGLSFSLVEMEKYYVTETV